jgi:Fe-S cluster biogenesis protein NfuA
MNMSGASSKIAVFVEPTPNPNSLKFIVGREVVAEGSYEFSSPKEAEQSFLARSLFEIPGVEGVFIGRNFVTVRKQPDADWDAIESRAIETIEDGISSGRSVVETQPVESGGEGTGAELKIRRILDEEIRPAVASDGGDVRFQSYADGVLTLRLVGSCSGCPSSTMTLKMGIERRLREDVPELKEVVSLM